MGWLDALRLAGSGMYAQRLRMEVAAQNLANADATRTPEGGPYRRKEVVVAAVPRGQRGPVPLMVRLLRGQVMGDGAGALEEVRAVAIVDDPSPPKRVYDPGHPDADAQGYVLMPNVDVPMEMVDLMAAARAYEASAVALQTLRRSVERALELIR